MKMYRNLNGRRGAKFPAMALSYFTVTIAHLYAFLEILKLEASPVEGQSLLQKDKKRRNGRAKKFKKNEKPKDMILISAHTLAKMSPIVVLVERKAFCHAV